MDVIEEPLRFIKFSKKTDKNKYSQTMLITTDFNISYKILYKMIHARCDIENSVFINLKNILLKSLLCT